MEQPGRCPGCRSDTISPPLCSWYPFPQGIRINSSPIVALNHAAAVAMSEGLEKGLSLLEEACFSGKLDHYYLFHASRADLLRRLSRSQEAATAYTRALSLATNRVEQQYIRKRLIEVT